MTGAKAKSPKVTDDTGYSAPTATTAATYQMNLVNGALPKNTYISNISVANTWRMNLGLRLMF